ncbi:hypothetical protein AB0F43_31260 [Kribbella sp. NPDC023972]|uniref:hypothetical protein n=1 Tax=Kribbella sp. NPDC023972 TaxID=3154795 RepID=UPI0034053B7D
MRLRTPSVASRSELLEQFVVDEKNSDELRGQDFNVTPTKDNPVVIARVPADADDDADPGRELRAFAGVFYRTCRCPMQFRWGLAGENRPLLGDVGARSDARRRVERPDRGYVRTFVAGKSRSRRRRDGSSFPAVRRWPGSRQFPRPERESSARIARSHFPRQMKAVRG